MNKEQALLLELTKSELAVYEYLKERAETTGSNEISESNRDIGKKINLSEATVHRALRKLRKLGIVGIIPSEGRAQSNTIVFHGIHDETEDIDDIFNMVSQLNSSVNRFQHVLMAKNNEIMKLQNDLHEAYEHIRELKEMLEKSHEVIQTLQQLLASGQENDVLANAQIENVEHREDGTIALVVRKNN
jgi:DNA-binding Lrp family transcriptional regulator